MTSRQKVFSDFRGRWKACQWSLDHPPIQKSRCPASEQQSAGRKKTGITEKKWQGIINSRMSISSS